MLDRHLGSWAWGSMSSNDPLKNFLRRPQNTNALQQRTNAESQGPSSAPKEIGQNPSVTH
jgi:hypothetical protein